MAKLTHPLLFLAVFYSAISTAERFTIHTSFPPARSPSDQPSVILAINQYCTRVATEIGLVDGKASFPLDTIGNILTECGYVHSSATFAAQTYYRETKIVFEFYKPLGWGTEGELNVKSSAGYKCTHESSSNDLYLECTQLAEP